MILDSFCIVFIINRLWIHIFLSAYPSFTLHFILLVKFWYIHIKFFLFTNFNYVLLSFFGSPGPWSRNGSAGETSVVVMSAVRIDDIDIFKFRINSKNLFIFKIKFLWRRTTPLSRRRLTSGFRHLLTNIFNFCFYTYIIRHFKHHLVVSHHF